MEFVDFEQGSEEWLKWRMGGIGSSDAAAIMGSSPWKTPFQLWEEKLGLSESGEENWAQSRGKALEPVARAQYELLNSTEMPSISMQHPDFLFMRASLDGFNSDSGTVLEIKCPGKEDHVLAVAGKVPEKYYPQLQHQMFVSGALVAHYYSYDGTSGVLVEVKRDEVYIRELLEACKKFWKCVQTKEPPPMTDRDYVDIEDTAMIQLLEEWKAVKKDLASIEEEESVLRKQIQGLMTHPRMRGNQVSIIRSQRKGSVEYAKIPELKNVDLEKYRKPATEVITFRLEEE